MALSIADMHEQLVTDVQATQQFLLNALARGDSKAAEVWQSTLRAAEHARDALAAYRAQLEA